jgi:biotin operon repressor
MEKNENASKDEQIGFHKGALSTLVKERQELSKILNIVEQLMQMHINALKELGVDLESQAKEAEKNTNSNKPIDDLLK